MVFVALSTDGGPKTLNHEAVNHAVEGKFIELFTHNDVHIYFIDPEVHFATKRDATTVKLVMIPHEDETPLSDVVIPPAFLEADGWFYPLIPSKSPVFRTEEKYYIFPDLLSSPGASVGIVFPDYIPSDERDLFEDILLNLAGLDEFPNCFAGKFGNPGGFNTIGAVYSHSNENQSDLKARFISNSLSEKVKPHFKPGEMAGDGVLVGGNKTFEFMSFKTKEGEAKFHVSSNYHHDDNAMEMEHTGNAVEINGCEISRLAYATSKLSSFTLDNKPSTAFNAIDTVNDQTPKETIAIQNKATATTEGKLDANRFVYASLYNAGRTLAHSIMHKHIMDHRMRDWKNSTVYNGTWSKRMRALHYQHHH